MRQKNGLYEVNSCSSAIEAQSPHYAVNGGQMVQVHVDGSEEVLTNFSAEITKDLFYDDGIDSVRHVEIKGQTPNGEKFSGVRPIEDLEIQIRKTIALIGGPRLRIFPSCSSKAADAIKALSNPKSEIIYTHTGWRQIGNKMCFLLPGGSLGTTTAKVEIPHGKANLFHLPNKVSEADVRNAFKVFKGLFKIAAPNIMWPIVSHTLSAPLMHFLPGCQRTALHITGTTGSYKTTLTCLVMNFFGDFSSLTPTETWKSTPNALERIGFHYKDLPFLIDDFKLSTSRSQNVVQLLQTYADGTAKARMDQTATIRKSYPIRGTVLSTGEDVPPGEASLLSRMLVLDLSRNAVDVEKLTESQYDSRWLPFLTSAFLHWLSKDPVEQEAKLKISFETLRDFFLRAVGKTPGFHPRLASGAAVSALGGGTFINWAVEKNLLTYEEGKVLKNMLLEAWIELLQRHAPEVLGQQADAVFMQTLKQMLSTGRVRVDPINYENDSRAPLVGWIDDRFFYMDGGSAYHEVQRFLSEEKRALQFSQRAIYKQLAKTFVLYKAGSVQNDSEACRVRINGRQRRVIVLSRDVLE